MTDVYHSKFRPGIYPSTQISWKYRAHDRAKRQLAGFKAIREKDTAGLISGFWALDTWRDLQRDPGILEQLLDDCAEHDQAVILKIWDRWFGSKKHNPPIPAAALKLGKRWASDTYSGHIWTPEYVDLQLELMQKLSQFDEHPGLEQIHWGETSIAHDGSAEAYTDELIRLWHGCKEAFPHTTVPININFLGDDNTQIRRIRDVHHRHGGGGLCNPDTVPGHKEGYEGEYPLWIYDPEKRPYYIDAYKVIAETDSIPIAPHIETWAMNKKQTEAAIMMALNYFGATHIKPQTDFRSKHDTALGSPKYFDEYVYPAIKKISDKQRELMAKRPARLDYRPNGYDGIAVPVESIIEDKIIVNTAHEQPGINFDVTRPKNLAVPGTDKWVINAFGFPVKRVLETEVPNEKYPAASNKVLRAQKYSTHQPWSSDSKYFLTYEGSKGYSFLLDGHSGDFIKVLKHNLYEAMWLPELMDGHRILVGIDRTTHKPTSYNVDTDSSAAAFSLDLKGFNAGKSEGHITQQCKVLYTKVSGAHVHCLVVDYKQGFWTKQTLVNAAKGFDTATLSHDGRFIVAMVDDPDRTLIYRVEDGSSSHGEELYSEKSHSVLVQNKGVDKFCSIGYMDSGGARYVVAWDLVTKEMEILLGGPGRFTNNYESKGQDGETRKPGMNISGHAGHAAGDNVVVSMIDPEGPHTVSILSLDGSQNIIPISYTHDPKGNYLGEGQAVGSPDGTRVALACLVNGVRVSLFVDTSSIKGQILGDNQPETPVSEPEVLVEQPLQSSAETETPVDPMIDVSVDISFEADESVKKFINKLVAAFRAYLEKLFG